MLWSILDVSAAEAAGTTGSTASCCSSSEGYGALFWTAVVFSTLLTLYILLPRRKDEKKHLQTAYKLPNGMFIYSWSGYESYALYKEIFDKACYQDGGIQLDRGATIVDAGANIGMFSLWAYRECEGEADVYAFEPIPSTFEVLEKNAQAFGNGRIKPFRFGLNDKEEDVVFEHHPNASIWSTSSHELATARAERVTQDMATVLTGDKAVLRFIPRFIYVCLLKLVMRWVTRKEKVACHLRRLGDVIKQEKIEKIDLLKVDVEGAEFSVLEGINDDQWPIVKQVALEVESFERVYQIRGFLRQKGFYVYWRATEREDGKDTNGSVITSEVCMLYALREPTDSITTDSSGYILREGHTAPKEPASSGHSSPTRRRSFRRSGQ